MVLRTLFVIFNSKCIPLILGLPEGSMKNIVIFQDRVSKFGDLLEVWTLATTAKFQLKILKRNTAKPKNTVTLGLNILFRQNKVKNSWVIRPLQNSILYWKFCKCV